MVSFAAAPDDHAEALHDVRTARAVLEATRRRVARREAGAADVTNAEYRLHGALKRLDALGWPDDPGGAAP